MTDASTSPAPAAGPVLLRQAGAWLAGLVGLVLALGAFRQRWISEEGLLVARVAENLASGHGPVVNPGERVEATASPLWVVLVAAGHAVTRQDASTVAVLLGLVLGIAGVAAGVLGAWRLHAGGGGLMLPVGLVVLLAVTPVGTYLTSGGEIGLVLCWIGVAFAALVGEVSGRDRRRWPTALWLGLGPVVSVSTALAGAVFAVAWLWSLPGRRERLRMLPALLAPAAVVEVFRAGYYASLLPAPLLARQTGPGSASAGWEYLGDLAGRSWLLVPLVAAYLMLLACRSPEPGRRAPVLAPPAAALLLVVGQVALGVTSAHARALVPALVLAVLPVLVVPWPARSEGMARSRVAAAGATAALVWAALVGTTVRPDYVSPGLAIPDERAMAAVAGQFPPGLLARGDLSGMGGYHVGSELEADARSGEEYFLESATGVRHPVPPGHGVGTLTAGVGLIGYLAPSVWVVDDVGVLDPVAARLSFPDDTPALIGNRRLTDPAWVLAAHTVPDPQESSAVTQARVVLACGDVADLRAAVRQPLTPGRFLSNLAGSWRFTTLDVPVDPTAAREALC